MECELSTKLLRVDYDENVDGVWISVGFYHPSNNLYNNRTLEWFTQKASKVLFVNFV